MCLKKGTVSMQEKNKKYFGTTSVHNTVITGVCNSGSCFHAFLSAKDITSFLTYGLSEGENCLY